MKNGTQGKSIPTTMDEYITGFPDDIQKILQQVRVTIHNAAPDAKEKISYQMPTFYLEGNLVHFAAFKNHLGFFPAPSGVVHFQTDLEAYKTSKGTIQFPLDKPIPYALITKIVLFRVKENLAKAKDKKRKTS